jgi:hypothetical protein
VRYINRTTHEQIDAAIVSFNRLMAWNSPMIEDLKQKYDFEYDSGSGPSVAYHLLKPQQPIVITTYRPKIPWSKAIASYQSGLLKYNERKLLALHMSELVGNLLHEWAHHSGFHHGNNFKTKHKCEKSVPYYLSENVNKWL